MYPRANLDELLPPLEPADEAFPETERVAPTNEHPVTQHDLGFGQGMPNTEQFAIHSDPGSHSPTPNQSQSSIPNESLAIPMTGFEVNGAKATGFVESPARFFAAVGQTTASPEDAPTREPGDATMDDTEGTSGHRDEGQAEEQPSSPERSRSRSQHGSRVRSVAGRR
eukprot:4915361-Karenia_brevis.AAC.1